MSICYMSPLDVLQLRFAKSNIIMFKLCKFDFV
nr:MAG TPA: hypothetical protein [Caudoviricetes sp.]